MTLPVFLLEPENKEYSAETESSVGGLPDSVQLFDSLMKTLWPDCRLLEHGIYGRLVVSVTSVINDHFFYGHVTDFVSHLPRRSLKRLLMLFVKIMILESYL